MRYKTYEPIHLIHFSQHNKELEYISIAISTFLHTRATNNHGTTASLVSDSQRTYSPFRSVVQWHDCNVRDNNNKNLTIGFEYTWLDAATTLDKNQFNKIDLIECLSHSGAVVQWIFNYSWFLFLLLLLFISIALFFPLFISFTVSVYVLAVAMVMLDS